MVTGYTVLLRNPAVEGILRKRPGGPDLLERFLANAPLSEVSWPTVYASGPKGYTDYPAHDAPTLAESSEEEYSNSHERMEELV
jgi:hypothetical protein